MTKTLTELRTELQSKIVERSQPLPRGDLMLVSWNSFASIVESVLGKETADESRRLAIQEGKWIKMDGKVYNGS